jgi:hypothetical protein
MLDLDQIIKERHSTRMFLHSSQCRGSWSVRPSLWRGMRRQTPTSRRDTWCSRPERSGTASLPPSSTRPGDGRPISHPCQSRSRTFAEIWVFKSTGRWESFARTRRAGGLRSCATGSSAARHWLALSACTGTSAQPTPSAWDASANVALSLDRTGPRRLFRNSRMSRASSLRQISVEG